MALLTCNPLEQPQEFKDDHNNDNHSDYIKDVSVHASDLYQTARAMVNISSSYQPSSRRFHLQRKSPEPVNPSSHWAPHGRDLFRDEINSALSVDDNPGVRKRSRRLADDH